MMSSGTSIETPSTSSSSGICSYERHPCSRPRYQKYKYCAQHILEDTSSPFTSCEYVSRTSGRKCPNPALRLQRANNLHAFCAEHLRELIVKEQHQKQKRKLRKKRKNGKLSEENSAIAKRQKLIDQLARYNQDSNKALNQESPDSDAEEVHRPITDDWLLDNEELGSNADWDDFDPVNNEVYEPLRYADVLTPEEVVATAQSKLIRLQSLYIEQFKRLFHLLKERRRQYLHDRKKETPGTSGQGQDDADSYDEDEIYALATYRKRTSVEALLRKRQLRRRQEADGNTSNFKSTIVTSRCSHSTNHTRCRESCLPYTKYCRAHILSDPHQQLYKKCHWKNCLNTICFLTTRPHEVTKKDGDNEKIEEFCYCVFHAPLPEMTFKFPEPKTDVNEMEVDIVTPEEAAKTVEAAENSMDGKDENSGHKFAAPSEPSITAENGDTQPLVETTESDDIEKSEREEISMDVGLAPELDNVPDDAEVSVPGVLQNPVMEQATFPSPSEPTVPSTNSNVETAGQTASQSLNEPNVSRTTVKLETTEQTALQSLSEPSVPSTTSKVETTEQTVLQSPNEPIVPSTIAGLKTTEQTAFQCLSEPSGSGVSTELGTTAKVVEPMPSNAEFNLSKMAPELLASNSAIPHAGDNQPEKTADAQDVLDSREQTPKSPVETSGADGQKCANPQTELTPVLSDLQQEEDTTVQVPEQKEVTEPPVLAGIEQAQTSAAGNGELIPSIPVNTLQPEGVQSPHNEPELVDTPNQPELDIHANPKNPSERPTKAEDDFSLDPATGILLDEDQRSLGAREEENVQPANALLPVSNVNNNCSGIATPVSDLPIREDPVPLPAIGSPIPPLYLHRRGERKPSSAEEELAVHSLLSLCTGHPSDDNAPSSSTEQD